MTKDNYVINNIENQKSFVTEKCKTIVGKDMSSFPVNHSLQPTCFQDSTSSCHFINVTNHRGQKFVIPMGLKCI